MPHASVRGATDPLEERNRRERVVFALLVILAGLAAAAGTALAASSASVFTDPSGDSGAAPDVTEVQVGNDVVAGPLVLWITAPNRTTLGGSEGVVTYLDTDLNGDTGERRLQGGADFGIETMSAGSRLYRWDGADWARPRRRRSVTCWVRGGARGADRDPPARARQSAGVQLLRRERQRRRGRRRPGRRRPLELLARERAAAADQGGCGATPARAGRPFTLRLEVGRDDINEILGAGRVTCTAKLGTTSLRGMARAFGANGSTCTWTLPRAARGKRISAKIVVGYGRRGRLALLQRRGEALTRSKVR